MGGTWQFDKLCFSATHLMRYWKNVKYVYSQWLCVFCIFWKWNNCTWMWLIYSFHLRVPDRQVRGVFLTNRWGTGIEITRTTQPIGWAILTNTELWRHNVMKPVWNTQVDSALRTKAEFIQHSYVQYFYSWGIHRYVNIRWNENYPIYD